MKLFKFGEIKEMNFMIVFCDLELMNREKQACKKISGSSAIGYMRYSRIAKQELESINKSID